MTSNRQMDGLSGLDHVSTGARPGCSHCNLPDGATDDQVQLAEESHFSWEACDACNSTLGGDRHPAHGIDPDDGSIVHLDVCTDCLMAINGMD